MNIFWPRRWRVAPAPTGAKAAVEEVAPAGAMFFVAGILVMQAVPELPPLVWPILALLTMVGASIRWKSFSRPCRLLALLAFGMVVTIWQAIPMQQRQIPPALAGKDVIVQGIVATIGQQFAGGKRFELEVVSLPDSPLTEAERNWRGRLRLSWYDQRIDPKPGQVWRFMVRLKPAHGTVNPGAFDYERWLFSAGINGSGYVRDRDLQPHLLADQPWRYPVQRARARLLEKLTVALADTPTAGLLVALAVGDVSAIEAHQWRVISATGTNHLLAISGLQIGLVGGLAYLLFHRLWRSSATLCGLLPAPLAAALLALAPVIIYSALAGFSVPVRRALIMFLVPVLVLLGRGRWEPLRLLSVAVFLVALLDPMAVTQAGFWLSFGAVGLILWALSGGFRKRNRWWQWGRVQVWISIGLIPILLLLYQSAPLLGIPANLIAIPVINLLVVPLTLLGTLWLPLASGVGEFFLHLASLVLDQLWVGLVWLARYADTWNLVAAPPLWAATMGLAGILLLLAPPGMPARWLGVIWCLPLFFYRPPGPDPGQYELTLLDVGQGLSAVVRTTNNWLVFDTGPTWSERFSSAESILLPFLRSAGAKQLGALVLSHADADHIGSYDLVLERLPVQALWSGTPEQMPQNSAAAFLPCSQGRSWQWDGVRFEFLTPGPEGRGEARNNRSCVLLVTGGSTTLLLTGDIEKDAELELLEKQADRLRADVLVVPHHGSRSSSSWSFVRKLSPRLALISSGYLNAFHHPAQEIVERYRSVGSRVLNTATSGALQVRSRAGQPPAVRAWREEEKRYWRHRAEP